MANKYTKTPNPPKDELENLYHNDFMSQSEIAEKYGVTQKIVWRWFRDLNIKSRKPYKRNQKGSKNDSWKGENATYAALHYRVEAKRGKPNFCEACGIIDKSKRYEWANLTGNYTDVMDYSRMCVPCHRKYDKNRPNSSKNVKRKAK